MWGEGKGHTSWWSSVSPEWTSKLQNDAKLPGRTIRGTQEERKRSYRERRRWCCKDEEYGTHEEAGSLWRTARRMTLMIWKTSTYLKWRHLSQKTGRPELDKPPNPTPPIPRRTERIQKQPTAFSDYDLYLTTMDSVAPDSDSDPG